jgi:hypothetical protein
MVRYQIVIVSGLTSRGDCPNVLPIGNKAERTEKGQEMTRKDYELIANVIKQFPRLDYGVASVLEELAEDLSVALSNENPRFDRARFIKACGVTN